MFFCITNVIKFLHSIPMPSFLTHLAQKIAENSETPLENTIIILPNKRTKRELLRELASHFTKPVFAPNIISVNEFIESLSSLKKIDNDELLMRLFEIYKKKNAAVETDNYPSLQTFLTWAPIFLQDINEIDLHLADATSVFSNLSEVKTLETSFGKENLTEAQSKYLHFYKQLAGLYVDFTTSLRAENVGYEGMIYKDAAKNPLQILKGCPPQEGGVVYIKTPCHKNTRYIFAGFNAVTPAELEILHYFYAHKNAEIYFDIDLFYDNKYGVFIEEIRQKLRIAEIPKSNDYKNIPKKISCIGAPKRTTQIYQAIETLNTIVQQQGNLNDTVLVLADETMLLPFVHAYNCENANITMGYPLHATFAAQQLQQYIDTEKQNNRLQKPIYNLKTQGFEFLQFLKFTFQKSENENINLEENTHQLIITLLDDVSAFLEKFFTGATELDFTIVEYFLQERMNATTIPFTGNAHEGLQIMGLLETRMLDFKNVIVLSMNEGVLPKGKSAPSMLLYDIKRHFGLSTHQRKDAIFGYHFFRLLQRAENVFLIYDNESTNTLAEKSRFLEQLEFEVKKQHLQGIVHIFDNQFVLPFSFPANDTEICIPKTATTIEKLIDFKYSPTSLSAYIQCPLQFYWKYIEKINTPEVFDQANESAIIGTVIHNVLEEVFTQLQQKSAQFAAILSEFAKNIDEILLRAFREQPEIATEDIYHGKLYLAYQIVKKSILDYIKVIQNEWEIAPFQIIGTEIPLVAQINIESYKLRFAGKADRVEIRDNKVTILDYKTGKVEAKKLQCKIEEIETIFTTPDLSQLFQLLCYAYLYQNSDHSSIVQTAEFQCGIIAFQELYKQNDAYIYYAEINEEKTLTHEILQLFEHHLKLLFSAILDKKSAFCQTNRVENCQFCDYKNICNL
ncbi:MAG: PD-(D/E)XK nuclease family protein [Bacteroidetes bacterium]|nr:PD-(D/E)XK nuclease family protein [Bacteroidota bacterium]MCL2302403.1 PD-(D/E)XK nuclease family protein [Lentimicrobiaceae bacterium]